MARADDDPPRSHRDGETFPAPVLATAGALTVSIDRLFGVARSHTSSNQSIAGIPLTQGIDGTSISVLQTQPDNLYAYPRVALDYTLGGRITVGGAAGLMYHSSERYAESQQPLRLSPLPTTWGFMVAPRAGYVWPIGAATTLWMRGGFSYYRYHSGLGGQSGSGATASGISANLEPTLVFLPTSRVGLSVALVADLPLTGSVTPDHEAPAGSGGPESYDLKLRNVALVFGALVSF